jgi:hypothetical protein
MTAPNYPDPWARNRGLAQVLNRMGQIPPPRRELPPPPPRPQRGGTELPGKMQLPPGTPRLWG